MLCNRFYYVFSCYISILFVYIMKYILLTVRTQLTRISSLFPPFRFWNFNSGCHNAERVLLLKDLPYCTYWLFLTTKILCTFNKDSISQYFLIHSWLNTDMQNLLTWDHCQYTNIEVQDTSKAFGYAMKFYWNKYLWKLYITSSFNYRVDLRISRYQAMFSKSSWFQRTFP